MKQSDKMSREWANVIAKAWADEKFKRELLQNPHATLKKMGVNVPSTTKIVENSANHTYLVLPEKPREALSETELKKRAAGLCFTVDIVATF